MSHLDYKIESLSPHTVKVSGIARLEAKEEYLGFLEVIRTAYFKANAENSQAFTIDLSDLSALNSSGVSSLLYLVQELRNNGFQTPILLAAGTHDWQKRSLPNVMKLWPSKIRISKPEGIL